MTCIPHPFDLLRSASLRPTKEMLRGIDLVEVFNSRCVFQRFNDDALRFARENTLGFSAGSDAHTLDEVGNAGVTVRSLEDLRNGKIEVFGGSSPAHKLLVAKLRKRLRRL
jgi:predicted metal-dependent phosphoesterase TrpH